MKKLFLVLVLVSALLLISACGTPATPTAPEATATPVPLPTTTLSPEDLQEAMFLAAGEDDIEAMKRYIAAGVDVNRTNEFGANVIRIASYRSNAEMATLLLEAGATFEIEVFHDAISQSNGQTDIVEAFLPYVENIDEGAQGLPGHNALMFAAEHGYIEIGELLLDHGANIDEVDRYNDPALAVAAFHGQLGFVKMLVERGAQLDKIGFGGRSAVGHALYRGHEEVAAYLIEVGAPE